MTPSGDKKEVASSWISTGWQRLRQMRPRQERQLAKERQGSTKKAAVRTAREGVWSAVGCRGPSATLRTSCSVDLAISAPMGMGPGPKHIYTLTLGSTDRGHPALSLGLYVTAVTAILPLFHQRCFTFWDIASGASLGSVVSSVIRSYLLLSHQALPS